MTRTQRADYWTRQQELYRSMFGDVFPSLRDGLTRYVVDLILPGGFLAAVLQNDLRESFSRADEANREGLFALVVLLHNAFPADAWGSREKVREWLDQEDDEPAINPRLFGGCMTGGGR